MHKRLDELVRVARVLHVVHVVEREPVKRRRVVGIVPLDVADGVQFLDAAVGARVDDLAEDGRARLLVPRHDVAAQERIDERRLARVEVSRDEHAARRVEHARAELGEVAERGREAAREELRQGAERQRGDEGGELRRGRARVAELEVERQDRQRVRGRRGRGVLGEAGGCRGGRVRVDDGEGALRHGASGRRAAPSSCCSATAGTSPWKRDALRRSVA